VTQDGLCDGHVAGKYSETRVSGLKTRLSFVNRVEGTVLIYTDLLLDCRMGWNNCIGILISSNSRLFCYPPLCICVCEGV
jgi:hypothetical protein